METSDCDTGSGSERTVTKSELLLPFWESGSGLYGDTLGQTCRRAASSCTDLTLSLLDTVPVNTSGVFTIGDYGANDGYSSMPLFTAMIGHLREKHGEKLPIQIIYEDQEKNDFNSLFTRLNDVTSYMTQFRNVYPVATNINFYKQCVPDGTCDIIFSNLAAHILENVEMTFKDAIFDIFASEAEREQVHAQAEQDWIKFLMLRAKELKTGGLLIIQGGATRSVTDIGQETSPRDRLGQGETVEDLEDVWKQLREEKLITQEEYERCSFQAVYRTVEEIRSAFEMEGSAVQQCFHLLRMEPFTSPCPLKAQFAENKAKGMETAENRARFAHAFTQANRVLTYSTFLSSLSDMRTDSEKAAIMGELYPRFEARVKSKNPESYGSDISMFRLVARKI